MGVIDRKQFRGGGASRRMGRRAAIGLGLAATLSLSGCGGNFGGGLNSFDAGLADFGDKVAIEPGRPGKVALLAPLGQRRTKLNLIGRSLANGAQLALNDLGLQDPAQGGLELKLYDTGGTAEGAARAAEAATADGAALIIGPLLSRSVSAAGPVARRAGVPMIAFSTDSAVAGGNVFLIGFLPEGEMERMASFTASRGFRNYGAMAPSTLEGQVVLSAFERAVGQNGGDIVVTERYRQTFAEIEEAAKRYATTHNGYAESRPIQAVLLADGGQSLSSAAAYLPHYEIDLRETRLIGIGKWNDASTLSDPSLRGGWFAGPDPRLRDQFAKRYQGAFGDAPHALASLGYDAMAAAGAMLAEAKRNNSPYPFVPRSLVAPEGFVGVNGVFRFRPNGLNERGLAVLEVRENGLKVIDPAPTGFTGG